MKKHLIDLILLCVIFCMTFTACAKIPPQNTGESQSTSQKSEATEQTVPKSERYAEALSLIEEKDYGAAYAILKNLGNYEDAEKHLGRLQSVPTSITITNQGKDEYFYNENGLLSKYISTDFYGRKDTHEFTYDENNRLLRVDYTYDIGTQTHVDYTYDENGNLIRKTTANSEGTQRIEAFTYDENGRLLQNIITDASGQTTTFDFSYDEYGNLSREVGSDGSLTTTDYIYDQNGSLLKKHSNGSYINDKGVTYSYELIWEYVYDTKGNLTKETYTDIYPGGYSTDIIEYTYDARNNLTRKVNTDVFPHPNGTTIYQTTVRDYTYDENGLVIQMRLTDKNGIESVLNFTYDENRNMIKETAGPVDNQRVDLCTYDESGRMTKLFRTQPDGTTFSVDMPSQWIYLPEDIPESTDTFLKQYFNRNYRTPIF